MIVFDASTLVSAAFRRGSVPDRAVRHALHTDQIAVSGAVMVELPAAPRHSEARPSLSLFGLYRHFCVSGFGLYRQRSALVRQGVWTGIGRRRDQ